MPNFALFLFTLICWSASAEAQTSVPAFPGAYGFGADTPGGRGGRVLYVDNLNDRGPGSLRAAIETPGPRTILFRVSGVIRLESDISIRIPFVTIAGQTAPGDGITIANRILIVRTNDVVIRHLRLRPGDTAQREQDALWVSGGQNVVIDHVSASWGIDETLSVTESRNVTVQRSIISESLNNSYHSKGLHGYGSLINSYGGGGITFHSNIYAHHRGRSPRAQSFAGFEGLLLDFRNNVIYDWGDYAGATDAAEPVRMNYVSNFLVPGPSTTGSRRGIAFVVNSNSSTRPATNGVRIFAQGNEIQGFPERSENNWFMIQGTFSQNRMTEPFTTPFVPTSTAREAYDRVLESAGAVLPRRDAVDARVVQQIREVSGRIIDSQTDVGGWPEMAALPAPADTDGDGMPDDWELLYGLDPNDPADGAQDLSGDGYTNLEAYLNGLDPRNRVTVTHADPVQTPGDVQWLPNYPNPFRGDTTLHFTLQEAQPVRIELYDLMGRRRAILADGLFHAGAHHLPISLHDLPAGTYFTVLHVPGSLQSRLVIHTGGSTSRH